MRVVFVSNFINHHQVPFCNAMYAALGADFCFIQTEAMTQERLRDGWAIDERMFSYVRFWEKEKEDCERLFLDSEIAIIGWSRLPSRLIAARLSAGKISFRVTERIYKEGQWKRFSPKGRRAKYEEHGRYRKMPVYLLCAGAYVASDFAKIGAYRDKRYRWGYFPETRRTKPFKWDMPAERIRLCWAGRMIDWKHPEYALKAAFALQKAGLSFTLDMAGDGPLRPALEEYADAHGLSDRVRFHHTMTPYEVRSLMEEAHIFLFTSNFLEGWGAVVNEAMNAGCAVLACDEAGSVPFLIREGANGLTFPGGDYARLEEQLLRLATDPSLQRRLGLAAYETIMREWNAEEAARRFCAFCKALVESGKETVFDDAGPMSRAPVIRAPGFFRTRREGMKQDHV